MIEPPVQHLHPGRASARHPLAGVDAALCVDNVTKTYYPLSSLLNPFRRRNGTQALQEVSFVVREGETLGLLGPNGAGKTTLLKIVSTLIYPTSGKVLLFGQDVYADPTKFRGALGLVTCDERSFYWRLSGGENLAFFAALYGLPKRVAGQRIGSLLEALDLSQAMHRPYRDYSSGMKQKLAIARGLLGEPRVVLYDEPTRSLDPLSTQHIRRWIRERRNTNPRQVHVIATNSLAEAEQLCDRMIVVNRGRLVAQGTAEAIRARWQRAAGNLEAITYRGPAPRSLFPEAEFPAVQIEPLREPRRDHLIRLQGGEDGVLLSRVLGRILTAGGVIVSCETEKVSFDSVFCDLIERSNQGD